LTGGIVNLPPNAALILIDVQQGFDDPRWGPRNNPDAERHMAGLLTQWRRSGRPVVHVQHLSREPDSPLRPDRDGSAFKPETAPRGHEPVFRKHVNSAFIGTGLESYLQAQGIQDLVLVGLTTDHCVSTSARMAANLGFAVTVVADATATFDRVSYDGARFEAEQMHCLALASLHSEFATIRRSEEILLALIHSDLRPTRT
jgi:nicotinamidase-related amidase